MDPSWVSRGFPSFLVRWHLLSPGMQRSPQSLGFDSEGLFSTSRMGSQLHPRNLRYQQLHKIAMFLKGVTFFHPVQAIILGYPTFESVYFPKFSRAVSCAQDSLTLRRFCWTSRSHWNDHIWHQISIQTYTIYQKPVDIAVPLGCTCQKASSLRQKNVSRRVIRIGTATF